VERLSEVELLVVFDEVLVVFEEVLVVAAALLLKLVLEETFEEVETVEVDAAVEDELSATAVAKALVLVSVYQVSVGSVVSGVVIIVKLPRFAAVSVSPVEVDNEYAPSVAAMVLLAKAAPAVATSAAASAEATLNVDAEAVVALELVAAVLAVELVVVATVEAA